MVGFPNILTRADHLESSTPLKVLLVEDNPGDVRIIQLALSGAGSGDGLFELHCVDRLSKAIEAISSQMFDAVLLDLNLPDSTWLKTVQRLAQASLGGLAIVVLTGDSDTQLGLESLRHGAQDHLMKGSVGRALLARSLQYAVQREQLHQQLQLQDQRALAEQIQMRQEVEKLLEQLQKIRDELELRVQDRTAALENVVYDLQEEVTTRMAAEQELRQANLWLKINNEIDQALIHSSTEETLLQSVCRTLVKFPGTTCAIVARPKTQHQPELTVCTESGGGEGCNVCRQTVLQNIAANSMADQPLVIDNISAQQEGTAWRELAELKNLRSLASMPLIYQGTFKGRLYMFSPQVHAFEKLKTEMLASVAQEIAYGMDALSDRRRRLEAENQARTSNQLLERLFANTHVMLAYMDVNFNFLKVNRRYAQANNKAEEYFIGKNHFELYPNAQNEEIFRSVVATGEPSIHFEKPFRYPDQDGITYWNWSLSPIKDAQNVVTGLILTLLNVTDHVLARQALHQSQRVAAQANAQLATIVESSDDAILGVSPDLRITSWNRGAKRMWGFDLQQVQGQSLKMLFAREGWAKVSTAARRLLAHKRVESFDCLATGDGGRDLELWIGLSPILDENGQLIGLSLIAHDVTELRRLEHEVLLISENERRRIGHDLHDLLGQNLTGTAFMCKVLEKKLKQKDLPEAEEASKIAFLLNESTTLSRSLARGLVPVEIRAEGLMTALSELCIHTGNFLQTQCTFDCPEPVNIENSSIANHLYRIAQEAITNAIKHGKAGAVVITLVRQSEDVTLTIGDNGAGFSNQPAAPDAMGMRIMKYRADMIGATLTVDSSKEKGTEVICTVRVPQPEGNRV